MHDAAGWKGENLRGVALVSLTRATAFLIARRITLGRGSENLTSRL